MNIHPASWLSRWLQAVRKIVLDYLRPGRNTEELLRVIGRAEAIQSDDQRNMLEEVVKFDEIRIREIMVSRSEIRAIASDASLHEAEKMFIEYGVNRMPVIEGDLDHVLGVVHIRDVVAARQKHSPKPAKSKATTPTKSPLSSLLRPCLRVSELEQIAGLLAEMKARSCHIAMVQDEYSGTAGLVTLSDLMREIVGEISELGEAEEAEIQCLDDGEYLVLARMHLGEFCEASGIAIAEGDYDTVAGWITTRLGRIPRSGESVSLDGCRIHILQADPRRVARVRIQQIGKQAKK